MRIYQLLPRLFGNQDYNLVFNGSAGQNGCGTLDDVSEAALASIKALGCDAIWLTGILDYATQTDYAKIGVPPSPAAVVKGKAGSPYAIRNFFDISPDLARNPARRMQAFEALLARAHALGLRVIVDFVPNHTARIYTPRPAGNGPASLNPAEGDVTTPVFSAQNFYFYLDQPLHLDFAKERDQIAEVPAKATGNDGFTPRPSVNDWYETVKINYGRDPRTGQEAYSPEPKSWAFMTQVLQFWAEKGVDGFRCDMVDMVPAEFWRYAITKIKGAKPEMLFIGESYIPDRYTPLVEAGFNYLYDKVALYDAVKDWVCGKTGTGPIGKALWDGRGHEAHLLRFTENHDEPRMASRLMTGNPEKAFCAFWLTAFLSPSPVMVYMGQELGERAEGREGFSGDDGKTTIFDYWSLDCLRRYNNGGKWDETVMTPAERSLRARYRATLQVHSTLEAQAPAVYNLQPANPAGYGPTTGPDEVMAALRTGPTKVFAGLVNPSNKLLEVRVTIPPEATPAGKRLLLGYSQEGSQFAPSFAGGVLSLQLPAYGAELVEFDVK